MDDPDTDPAAADTPWWLGDHETCPVCYEGYALQMEYRCVACDGPMCPMCVVTVTETTEFFCPGCREST